MKIFIQQCKLLILFAFILTSFKCYSQNSPVTFEATLQKHLTAIKQRDLPTLLSTVDDSLTLILPNGSLLTSKKQYEDLHIEWFADKNWSIEFETVNKVETPALSYALIKYTHTEIDTEKNIASKRQTYLNLVFKKKDKAWMLIHDQNTKLL
jgi:ketosteroid isomerase-like protein